ncbi:glycosyltransferase family 39 protein [Herbiconiux liukaitaii]|uniref:glycosyltransferase family 39 protein n=1 Tax=Herbiconiux liukaitaii TaxID=3342799 RepID=UPI0035B78284
MPRRADATLVGVLGFVVSFLGSWIPSIWYDEAATIASATRSWASLGRMVESVDAVHAVYYAVLHLWFDLVGYDPVTLRLPSAVFAGVAAALTVLLAARLLGSRRLGLLAGVVLIVLPRFTWAGGEGRSYALTMLLAVGLTLAFLAATGPSARWWRWLVYGALAVLSTAVFLYLALIVAAHAVTIVVRWIARRDTRELLGFGITAVGVVLASLPIIVAVVGQSGQLSWVAPVDQETWRGVFLTQFFPKNPAFAVAAWALMALGFAALLLRRPLRSVVAVLVPWLVVPTIAIMAASVLITPLYSPRYLTFALPAVAIAIAAAPMLVPNLRARAVVAVSIMTLLVVLAVPSYLGQRTPEAKQGASWSQGAGDVARIDRGEPTALVFGSIAYHPGATARVIEYAYPEAFRGFDDVALTVPLEESPDLWEKADPIDAPLLEGYDRAVLVTSGRQRVQNEESITRAGFREVDRWYSANLVVVLYERI